MRRGRDSKTPRATPITISTPLAVRQSQLSRISHSMTMASVLSRQRVVLRSTRWEGPCIMDTGPIPAGWIRAVSWSTETPDHISLRPPCSSDHPRSTSSYLVAFRANPSGSRGASGLPPLRPRSIDRRTRLAKEEAVGSGPHPGRVEDDSRSWTAAGLERGSLLGYTTKGL